MIFKPSNVAVVFGLSSALVQIGCSDDDEPMYPPTTDTSSASSDYSSSSDATFKSSATDAGVDAGAETSRGVTSQSSESSDAGVHVDTAVPDAGHDTDVGLLEALSRDPETTVFAQLFLRAEMEKALAKEGPFTVFAPINRAFDRLPEGYLAGLSRKQVETLVRNHLLYEPQASADLVAAGAALSVLELSHRVTSNGKDVYLGGLTRIVAADIALRDDVVHKVDSVLTVETFPGTLLEAVRAYPRLSEFASRLSEQDRSLLEQDGKTLFAPINGGFEGYSSTNTDGVSNLSYHLLDGKVGRAAFSGSPVTRTTLGAFMGVSTADGLTLSDGERVSRLLVADLSIGSGEEGSVLHVVDAPLVAPPRVDEVLAGAKGETFQNFRAKMSEVTAPGDTGSLLDYVADAEAVTVFAPTDDAFDRVPSSFQSSLAKVLGFHVIDGTVDSSRLLDADLSDSLTTSAVKRFEVVTVSDGGETRILLDGMVEVKRRDVPAANGIVHLIDGVLVPRDVIFPGTTAQALAAYPALSKVSTAVAESGLLNNGTSTLFAPFDLAFGSVTSPEVFVQTHAMSPGVREHATFGLSTATSMGGSAINVDPETLMVRGVKVVRPDLLTQSGVVHIVNGEFVE